jgi:hypothetical protein
MKTNLVASFFFLLINLNLNAQNLIGLNEQEIRKYMTENEKKLAFQSIVNNSTFKYLKYSDSEGTTTYLFFLNEQMVCKSVRMIYDKEMKAQKVKEFDSVYKKAGDNQWIETKENKSYLIVLKEEDYSFNVTIILKE